MWQYHQTRVCPLVGAELSSLVWICNQANTL